MARTVSEINHDARRSKLSVLFILMTQEQFIRKCVDTLMRCRSVLENFEGEHALVNQALVEIHERLSEHDRVMVEQCDQPSDADVVKKMKECAAVLAAARANDQNPSAENFLELRKKLKELE